MAARAARAGSSTSPFDLDEALRVVRRRTQSSPRVGLILGSGLGVLAEGVAWEASIPTADIPGLPRSTVPGHSGRLLLGRWAGRAVAVLQGRSHLYEGYSAEVVTRTVRLLAALGAKALVVTNAAGGITSRMTPGSLMLIEDQVNLQARAPLRGSGLEAGARGLTARPLYSADLLAKSMRAATVAGVRAERGVLGVALGPSYETPAEIRMLEQMGADAVCMSTAVEVSMAASLGVPVAGISCVANWAAGKSSRKLSHEEVTGAVQAVAPALKQLLERLILALA
jgi:purine-nucleoside phosphorylase